MLLPTAAAAALRETVLGVIGRSDVQPPRDKIAASHRDRRLPVSYGHCDVLLGLGAFDYVLVVGDLQEVEASLPPFS